MLRKVKGALAMGLILIWGIDWSSSGNEIVLSEKDNHHELLKDASWLFNYNESLY